MVYSINRAFPLAVFGFVIGAGGVLLLRSLQNLDPVWSPQIGLVIGGLVASLFFLWGIGAYSSAMAAHHVPEPEEDEFGNELPVEDHHHDDETPTSILGNQVWTVAFWVMVLFIGLLFFASLPGGFGYTVSNDPAANTNANGFFEFNWFGTQVYVSKLVAFILFVGFTIASLYVAAGLIARVFFSLNAGVKETQAVGNQPLQSIYAPLGAGSAVAALPSGETAAPVEAAPEPAKKRGLIGGFIHFVFSMLVDEPTPAHRRSTGERLSRVALLAVVFVVLYWLHYEALIGWIMPQTGEMTVPPGITFGPYMFRMFNAFMAALTITLLVLRTRWVIYIIGRVARFGAWVLRKLPEFLFQRD